MHITIMQIYVPYFYIVFKEVDPIPPPAADDLPPTPANDDDDGPPPPPANDDDCGTIGSMEHVTYNI